MTRALQDGLGPIPMVGGSAGDGLDFRSTKVFADGAFRSDSAVLILIHTELPFRTFRTQHFVPTDRRAVVTQADALRRIVTEIDGLPAIEGYARLLEIEDGEFDAPRFAAAPVVVIIDGNNYVRAIQRANSDGSLTFFCAVEEGMVLRLARGVDLVENLIQAFDKIGDDLGRPLLTIGFDCILRRLEIERLGIEPRVAKLFMHNRTIGFSTYGEQFHGVHVNQTLTGIAIGNGPGDSASLG